MPRREVFLTAYQYEAVRIGKVTTEAFHQSTVTYSAFIVYGEHNGLNFQLKVLLLHVHFCIQHDAYVCANSKLHVQIRHLDNQQFNIQMQSG